MGRHNITFTSQMNPFGAEHFSSEHIFPWWWKNSKHLFVFTLRPCIAIQGKY